MKAPIWLILFTILLKIFNGAANPIVYALFNESFRKGFRDILGCDNTRDLGLQQCANTPTKREPAQFQNFPWYVSQIEALLPCTCSVIRTKTWLTDEKQPSISPMFLPHFDVFCDLLLYGLTATWNLFVLYDDKAKYWKQLCQLCVCHSIDHMYEPIKVHVLFSFSYKENLHFILECYARNIKLHETLNIVPSKNHHQGRIFNCQIKQFNFILYLGIVIFFTFIIIMTVQDNFTS